MDIIKARRIQELRTGKIIHSFRRIAEIIEEEFPEYPKLHGNQLYGMDLVKNAMKTIYGKSFLEIDNEVRDLWAM
jgi:hypothetical protein